MKTGYPVGDIMTRDVECVTPNTNIQECAKIMADKKIGSLVIKNEEIVEGIITEQDLSRKVLSKKLNTSTTKAKDIMAKLITTIQPEEDLYNAFVLMGENSIKHLPVVSKGILQGIITSKDILQIQPGLIELLQFKNTKSDN